MYKCGEQVLYGIHGVCTVVESQERIVDKKRITYLVLEPVGQPGSKYFVPTHNAVAMSKLRPILDRDALLNLLSSHQVQNAVWVQNETMRKQRYRELINSGERMDLMCMCAALYRHRQEQILAGRKVHQCDENFLRDAEKTLCGEISLVMELEYPEAKAFLLKQLIGE